MFGCQSENRFVFILMKIKHPVHRMVFGVVTSDGDIMPSFIFPYGLRLKMKIYIVPGGGNATLDLEDVLWYLLYGL